jgi:NAD-dependent DNA ligase
MYYSTTVFAVSTAALLLFIREGLEMVLPIHTAFNRARIDDRAVNELLGLAKGMIADGKVNNDEAHFFFKWLVANEGVKSNPVVALLMQRVGQMLSDGKLDKDEAAELQVTLVNFAAGDFEIGELLKSTTLPLCNPPPEILFDGRKFCFTGTFAYGTRADCESIVRKLGSSSGSLTQDTDYLVVGVYATDSWMHSNFGRKIEKAVEWRQSGLPISIISEEHWVSQI